MIISRGDVNGTYQSICLRNYAGLVGCRVKLIEIFCINHAFVAINSAIKMPVSIAFLSLADLVFAESRI